MAAINLEQFTQALRSAMAELPRPQVQVEAPEVYVEPPDFTGLQGAIESLRPQPNQLSYYLDDPEFYQYDADGFRVPKSQDQIINTLTQRGLISFENAVEREKYLNMSEDELIKLGAVRKEIQDQSEKMYDYQSGKDYSVDKGFRRVGFDMFVKDGDKTKRGVPLTKDIKFIYDKIPPIHIKFSKGMYEAHQEDKVFKSKNFRDCERFAMRGGFYADELAMLRKVEKVYFKKEEPLQVIFKARKI